MSETEGIGFCGNASSARYEGSQRQMAETRREFRLSSVKRAYVNRSGVVAIGRNGATPLKKQASSQTFSIRELILIPSCGSFAMP